MNSATRHSSVHSPLGRDTNGSGHATSELPPSTGGRSSTTRPGRARSAQRSETGFTLVELLIVITVLPMIIGALSFGLLAVFSLQGSVTNRLSNSSDSQIVSANYIQDVQAAQRITTASMASAPGCGAASETQVLGLEWDPQGSAFQTVVSYVAVQEGSNYVLERNYCTAGPSTTPTSFAVVSYNMPPPTASMVTILPSSSSNQAQGGWTLAQPVTGVTLNIVEPGSASGTGSAPYAYTLVAVPSAAAPQGQQGSPTATTTVCKFALPNTGTYASSLCFIDFSPLQIAANQTSATSPGSMAMTVGIPGGYTLSFTVSITNEASTPMSALPFPTYSDSFMGNANNGTAFYSGVGCPAGTPAMTGSNGTPSCIDPSLYQTANASTNTITLGNIKLIDPEGVAATGWQLVSGDAETTDPNEYLTWTSNNGWSLIPNSPSSNEGNACNESVFGNPGPGGTDLTGLGTKSVTCESTWQDAGTPRTGAVMLESPTPTTVSASMKGAGLEGVFFGLMLPS
jgi:prepilin-type N-terminal cleavage/methylation domain-containing protein